MIAIEFDEVNVKIAEHQEQYETLPAYWDKKEGSLVCCFQLNKEEIDEIVKTGQLWHKQLTFGKPMNPISMSTSKEDLL